MSNDVFEICVVHVKISITADLKIWVNSRWYDEDGNKWLKFCPCVMNSVGDIQGIKCSLGPKWPEYHITSLWESTNHSPRCLWLAVCQSVHPSIWLTGPRHSCLSLCLTLSLSLPLLSAWCCIHIMAAWTDREGDGKVTLIGKACTHTNSWACTRANMPSQTNTHNQISHYTLHNWHL